MLFYGGLFLEFSASYKDDSALNSRLIPYGVIGTSRSW